MFVLGMGYVGRFFSIRLPQHGWHVSGTCKTASEKRHLERLGFPVFLFDADDPDPRVLHEMSRHTHLLISIPPHPATGDPMLRHKQDLTRALLSNRNPRRLCYLSSTGVYGECGGAWVDEDYVANPINDMAKMRLRAEDGWLTFARDLGLQPLVLRLGGIYGPGRSAVDTIMAGEALSEKKKRRLLSVYTSRIHISDACRAIEAGFSNRVIGDVCNVVDDDPTPRAVVFEYACRLIEERWPGLSMPFGSGLETNTGCRPGGKRVRNERMKVDLKIELLYPSYRCGLKNIIDDMHLHKY